MVRLWRFRHRCSRPGLGASSFLVIYQERCHLALDSGVVVPGFAQPRIAFYRIALSMLPGKATRFAATGSTGFVASFLLQ